MRIRRLTLLGVVLIAAAIPGSVAAQAAGGAKPPKETEEEIRRQADMAAALALAVEEARKRLGVKTAEDDPIIPLPPRELKALGEDFIWRVEDNANFDRWYGETGWAGIVVTVRPGGAERLAKPGAKPEPVLFVTVHRCERRGELVRKLRPGECDSENGLVGGVTVFRPHHGAPLQRAYLAKMEEDPEADFSFKVSPDGKGGWKLIELDGSEFIGVEVFDR